MIRWNEENKNILIELWELNTDEELSKILNCSIGSIKKERQRLGLKRKDKIIKNKKLYSYDDVKSIFKNHDYELIENEYRNYTTKMNYICNKHNDKIQKICLCDLLRGRGCYYCGREKTISSKQKDDEYYINECKKRDFIYIGKYMNKKYGMTFIKYICNKHKDIGIQEKPINNFKKCTCCPYCKSSKGEEKLKTILDNMNVSYDRQKRFDDCKDKYTLPFDFYLNKENILIEYDGELHYLPFNLSSLSKEEIDNNFKNYKRRDKIKTDYCILHKIPLIRIPYWEYDNMESFLLSKINEIKKENINNK